MVYMLVLIASYLIERGDYIYLNEVILSGFYILESHIEIRWIFIKY